MNAGDEIVAIVDEHNEVVGSAPRREMRARRLPHRSTYILVFNSRGELFVQKRSDSKDVHPGCYDPVAGGVVLAGESYEAGALRELEEELGIRGVPLERHFEFYLADVYDGPLRLQEEEISSGEFLPVDDVLRRARAEPFTPDGMYALRRYLDETPGRGVA
ncbi:MAG: NUDIX hydrolase [Acidobacteria bacterium]|nr:MAG: NUDIX hydrolase [Acidobacteriota bacterium]